MSEPLCPEIRAQDALELAIDVELGTRLRASRDDCRALYGALSNTDWTHAETGLIASYTFRHAGAVVAGIQREGRSYIDFYCSAPEGVVAPWIAEALARRGWTHAPIAF